MLTLDAFTSIVNSAVTANTAYHNGLTTTMTDREFDELIDAIEAAVDANPEFVAVEGVEALLAGVGATPELADVQHVTPMLSLGKKKTPDEIQTFLASVSGKVVVEPKIDGIAAVVSYVDGIRTVVATRGDGSHGENLTARIADLTIHGLPKTLSKPLTFEVRGELYMSPNDFTVSNANRVASGRAPFANERNATSGVVMRKTAHYEAEVSFGAYEVVGNDDTEPNLGSDSYTTRMEALVPLGISRAKDLLPPTAVKALEGGVMAGIEALGLARADGLIPALTDGAVVKADSTKVRETLGAGSRFPRWACAYKFDAETAQTELLDILRTVGRTGAIAYTAVMTEVTVAGSKVDRATLHNSDFIASHDLRIGDTVTLYKAGDIIPRVMERDLTKRPADSVPYTAPTTCPKCEEELNRSGVIWRCETASCSIVALLTYATSRDCLDIEGFSAATAQAVVDAELVSSLADLFDISEEQFAALPMGVTSKGNVKLLGETMAAKIVANIEKAKSQPLNRVFCALGIRKTGRTMSRRIANIFGNIDNILNATEQDLFRVEAVSHGRAEYILDGIEAMKKDIERMKAQGFAMEMPAAADSDGNSAPLAGKRVCVTGAMTGALTGMNRNQVQEFIESKGGTAAGSVSKTVDYLVCDAGSVGSSKHTKAVALGVTILSPDEFGALVGM